MTEVYCVKDKLGIEEFLKRINYLKEKGCRVTGIIDNNTGSLVTEEMKISCAELFEGNGIKILKGLLGVIEQSTHTQYPEEVYCFGSKDFIIEILKIIKNYEIEFKA